MINQGPLALTQSDLVLEVQSCVVEVLVPSNQEVYDNMIADETMQSLDPGSCLGPIEMSYDDIQFKDEPSQPRIISITQLIDDPCSNILQLIQNPQQSPLMQTTQTSLSNTAPSIYNIGGTNILNLSKLPPPEVLMPNLQSQFIKLSAQISKLSQSCQVPGQKLNPLIQLAHEQQIKLQQLTQITASSNPVIIDTDLLIKRFNCSQADIEALRAHKQTRNRSAFQMFVIDQLKSENQEMSAIIQRSGVKSQIDQISNQIQEQLDHEIQTDIKEVQAVQGEEEEDFLFKDQLQEINLPMLKAMNPEVFPTQLHEVNEQKKRELASKWSVLPEFRKQHYCREETKDKERYIQELRDAPKRVSLRRKSKRKGIRMGPKKILTPYMFYVKEIRPMLMRDQPDMNFIDIMRVIGKQWSAMSEEEKTPYLQRSEEDKRRFAEENESFSRTRLSAMPFVAQNGVFTPRSVGQVGKFEVQRGKRPLTGFLMFAKDVREKARTLGSRAPIGEMMKMAGQEWQLMTRQQKESYDIKARQLFVIQNNS